MLWVVQFGIAFVLAATVIAVATKWIIDRCGGNYRVMHDPEGNHANMVGSTIKWLSLTAIGIASGVSAPSIIRAFFDGLASLLGK